MRNKRAGKKFPPSLGMRTPSNQKHKKDPRPKARPADTWDDRQVSRGNSAWYRAMNRMIEKGMSEREIVHSISKKFKIDPMAIKKEIRMSRMANDFEADSDGNYMSVQNIQTILSAAQFLAEMIQDGDEMEDWVEDKISDARSTLSDVARFYDSGRMMTAATSRTFLAHAYKEALRKIQVQKLMGQGQFALITAYRNENSKSQNKERQTKLRVQLMKMGYRPETLKASWDGKTEQSLLVKNIPFGQAKALGLEYEQDAIIWKGAGEPWAGMYYFRGSNAGKVEIALDTKNLSVDYDVSTEADLYSKARGISFELDFHWGKFATTGGGALKPKHLERWFMAHHNMAVEVSNNEIKFI